MASDRRIGSLVGADSLASRRRPVPDRSVGALAPGVHMSGASSLVGAELKSATGTLAAVHLVADEPERIAEVQYLAAGPPCACNAASTRRKNCCPEEGGRKARKRSGEGSAQPRPIVGSLAGVGGTSDEGLSKKASAVETSSTRGRLGNEAGSHTG